MSTSTSWPEQQPSSTNTERVMKELVQGQHFANQLQTLLKKLYADEGYLSTNELVVNILRSFTQSLSLLSSTDSAGGEASQNLRASQVESVCWDDRTSEDSGEVSEMPATKDRRGCYRRKKTSQSWIIVSPTTEDGHAWRKYGQKEILNAKYPRSYFRCTRKFEQGCNATKQVQRMEDNPQMYQTIYFGHHTCRDNLCAPHIITVSNPWDSDNMVRSKYKIPNIQPDNILNTPSVKQESKEETPSDLTDNVSTWDNLMVLWKECFHCGLCFHCLCLDMDFVELGRNFQFADYNEFF